MPQLRRADDWGKNDPVIAGATETWGAGDPVIEPTKTKPKNSGLIHQFGEWARGQAEQRQTEELKAAGEGRGSPLRAGLRSLAPNILSDIASGTEALASPGNLAMSAAALYPPARAVLSPYFAATSGKQALEARPNAKYVGITERPETLGFEANPEETQKGLLGLAGVAGGAAGMKEAMPRYRALPGQVMASSTVQKAGRFLTPSKYLSAENSMTRAVKPISTNAQWDSSINSAMGDLKAAEARSGAPVRHIPDNPAAVIDRTIELTKDAKVQLWKGIEERLGPYGDYARVDKNVIADAIEGSLDAYTVKNNPALAKRIRARAATYRNGPDITLSQAEDFLHSINKRDATYFAKNKVDMRRATGDPEVAAELAEGDAFRGQINNKFDALTGPGVKEIKSRYGALSNVEKEFYRRRNVAARQAPESLLEQLSGWHGAAQVVRGGARILTGDIGGGAGQIGSAIAGRAAARYLTEINSTGSLIEQAFKKAGASSPPPAMVRRPIAGLLPPASRRMGSSLEPIGPRESPLPHIEPTTRAQRKGLLLPAAGETTGRIPMGEARLLAGPELWEGQLGFSREGTPEIYKPEPRPPKGKPIQFRRRSRSLTPFEQPSAPPKGKRRGELRP